MCSICAGARSEPWKATKRMAKKPKVPGYEEALEHLFKALDGALMGADQPILRKVSDKEHYETRLMFAVRRRQAARHHQDNVERMLAAASKATAKQMSAANKSQKRKSKPSSYSMSLVSSSGEYIYELVAFLAALRSGLDFLAMVAARSLPGVSTHSIHTLMKMAENGQQGAVIAVVKEHHDWLRGLKDYRDEVIHRLVIQAPTAGWLISHNGKTSEAILPLVVPRVTPKFTIDTRLSRFMEEEVPIGLAKSESLSTATFEGGAEKVLDHKISYQPTDDYVPIQIFMVEHLAAYDAFLADMFQALTATNFQQPKA